MSTTPASQMNEVSKALHSVVNGRGAPTRAQVDLGQQAFRDPRIPVGIITPPAVDAFAAFSAVVAAAGHAAARNAAARPDAHAVTRSNFLGRPARASSRDLGGGPGG